jgi:hypothetical protein
MQPDSQNKEPYWAKDLRQEIVQGLFYAHSRANANITKTLEAASFLYALIELLGEKGLITIEELDERKRTVGERLAKQFRETGMGAAFQDPEYDKYSFEGGSRLTARIAFLFAKPLAAVCPSLCPNKMCGKALSAGIWGNPI